MHCTKLSAWDYRVASYPGGVVSAAGRQSPRDAKGGGTTTAGFPGFVGLMTWKTFPFPAAAQWGEVAAKLTERGNPTAKHTKPNIHAQTHREAHPNLTYTPKPAAKLPNPPRSSQTCCEALGTRYGA